MEATAVSQEITKMCKWYRLQAAEIKTVTKEGDQKGHLYVTASFIPRDVNALAATTDSKTVVFFQPQRGIDAWKAAWEAQIANPNGFEVRGGIFTKQTEPHAKKYIRTENGHQAGELVKRNVNGVPKLAVYNKISVFVLCDNDDNPLEDVERLVDRIWSRDCMSIAAIKAAKAATAPAPTAAPAVDPASLIGGGSTEPNPLDGIDL